MPVLGESDRSNIMQQRAKEFKNRGLSVEDLRTRRRESNVELRKTRRDDQLLKRRRDVGGDGEDEDSSVVSASAGEAETPLAALCQGLYAPDPQSRFKAAQGIRKMLSKQRDPPIQTVLEANVVPRLVEFMTPAYDGESDTQLEAAWALTNIASGTAEQTHAVVVAGAVPSFVRLLKSPNWELAEQCVWALGNIAGDSATMRDYVLEINAMSALLELIQSNPQVRVVRNATWTLSNLCRGKNPPPPFELIRHALPTLARLIFSNDTEILQDAAWTLCYISDGDEARIDAVIRVGVTRRLVELLMHQQTDVVAPALRCLGNIVTGNEEQTQTVINCGALSCLLTLLLHTKENIRKEACWALSNITAGSTSQIQSVIDTNIVPVLLEVMKNDQFRPRKEACWAVANFICGGSDSQVKYIVKQGCIKPLVDALNLDSSVAKVTLDAFDKILRVGDKEATAMGTGVNEYATFVEEADGLDVIEQLQFHDREDIYRRARELLEKWFPADEDEVAVAAPRTNENQFVFGAAQAAPQGGFHF